jgi:hypothetical protein
MDMKRLIVGTVVGAVVLYVLGYVIFELAAGTFYAANRGPSSGAFRDLPLQWPLVVASVAYAALITLGALSRESVPSITTGAVVGAVIGFLSWLQVDLVFYSYMTTRALAVVVVDPLLEAIHGGITGAVIATVLAKVPRTAAIRPAV